MTISIQYEDEPSIYLARIVSSENEDEVILIESNGRILLEIGGAGQTIELWPGWAEEQDPEVPPRDYDENGEE